MLVPANYSIEKITKVWNPKHALELVLDSLVLKPGHWALLDLCF